jgi:hypothetical protein
MDKDILIQALRHQPRAVRSEALAALIGELDPHEWREVRNTLNARSFQFDLIGSLPLELVVRVFAHLDIGAPYRLQSVRSHP